MKPLLTLSLLLALANLAILAAFTKPLPTPPPTPEPTGSPIQGGTHVVVPPPRGNPIPGGTFSDSSQCKKTPRSLHALIPQKDLEPLLAGQGLTTSQYPTFWIYSPYSAREAIAAQFSLHDRRGRALYRTAVNLPKTAGILGIQIPPEAKYALEEGKFYHWYFSVKCNLDEDAPPDLVVDGWVKKVASTPETEAQINAAQPNIWYDSLTRLANLRIANPQDEKLKTDWRNLLTSVGLEALIQEPFVEPATNKD